MCKVLMISGIKPKNIPKIHELVKVAARMMSVVEDDGIGYAAITDEGNIYGEKWRNKDDAFKIHAQPEADPVISLMDSTLGPMADWSKIPLNHQVYDSFGIRDAGAIEKTVAVALHARKASPMSDKTIENLHPFVMMDVENQPDTAL